MNKIKFLSLSLVALLMACFTACENKYEAEHPAELVGTWTCLTNGYVEALVIKADGSALSTGYDGEDYWENVAGNIAVKNGTIKMTFEDGDNFEGHFDIVAGESFSIYTEEGVRLTFNYCENDLADEVIGMWVWVDSNNANGTDNMAIQTYKEDGTAIFTAFYEGEGYTVNNESTYRVIGDLLIQNVPNNNPSVMARRLTYKENATAFGDILTAYDPSSDSSLSWLRISQSLDLAGKGYYYHDVFVSNVDGLDQDIDFMGYTFNFAKMTNSELNKLLNSVLFNVEFPDANNIQYIYMYNNAKEVLEAPILVEGSKLTVKMSANEPALKDVVFYAFQDADNSQLHFYMHRDAFVNFHANMQVKLMAAAGQLNLNDAAAVKAVYDNIDAAVNTINVSLVFKAK